MAGAGRILGAALFLALGGAAGRANDSSIELAIGGVRFTKSPDVSMEEERLAITPETVSVSYRFVNRSDAPVTLDIGFPLPDIDLAREDEELAIPSDDPVNFVDFRTSVDGAPVRLDVIQRAKLKGRDVTAEVKAAGLPLALIGADAYDRLRALPAATREKLVADGLLAPNGTGANDEVFYGAQWTVSTVFARKQTFAPHAEALVEHHYRASVGMSVDTALRKGVRDGDGMEAFLASYRKDYCLNEDFFRGLDRVAGPVPSAGPTLLERRIAYVLKTGANWAGPIKKFQLTVDKGKPDRLVSFCFDNVRKASPTLFVAELENFTPKRDLKILMIGRD
ncbi:DUF4424 domain-containing protein [Methylocella sp.]|uniref:DUF4424 domain-containing protein n=1 Tax=Methylocella sp. TaxID=1978226 RepID=UPI003784CC67